MFEEQFNNIDDEKPLSSQETSKRETRRILRMEEDETDPKVIERQFEIFLYNNFSDDQIIRTIKEENIIFIRKVGEGSFSSANLCWKRDEKTNYLDLVVIKKFSKDLDSLNSCLNELLKLKELGKLDSKHLISLNGISLIENTILINYGYGNLLHVIQGMRKINYFSEFNEKELLAKLGMLIDGLFQMHSINIVHHDIKPDNILLANWQSGQLMYKYSDFNVSIKMDPHIRTKKMEENGRGCYYYYPCCGNIDYNPYLYDIKALVITFLQMIGLDGGKRLFIDRNDKKLKDILNTAEKNFLNKYPLLFEFLEEMFNSNGEENFLSILKNKIYKYFGSQDNMYKELNLENDFSFLINIFMGENGYQDNNTNIVSLIFQAVSNIMTKSNWKPKNYDFINSILIDSTSRMNNRIIQDALWDITQFYSLIHMIFKNTNENKFFHLSDIHKYSTYLENNFQLNNNYNTTWIEIKNICNRIIENSPNYNIYFDPNLSKEAYSRMNPYFFRPESFIFLDANKRKDDFVTNDEIDIIDKFDKLLKNNNSIFEIKLVYTHFLYGLGLFHQRNGNYNRAQFFYMKVYDFLKENQNFSKITLSYVEMNLSQILRDNYDYTIHECLQYAKDSTRINELRKDEINLFFSYNNLAILYLDKKKYDKSYSYFTKSITMVKNYDSFFNAIYNLKESIFYSKKFSKKYEYNEYNKKFNANQNVILQYQIIKINLMEKFNSFKDINNILYDNQMIKSNRWITESIKFFRINPKNTIIYFLTLVSKFRYSLIHYRSCFKEIPSFMDEDLEQLKEGFNM